MTHSKCIGPVSRVLTVTIVAIAMFAVLPAAPRDIPKDGIDREFFRLRGLLQNANVKLQNDVADLGAAQSGATSVAQTCCSGNLKKIGAALVGLQVETDRLKSCYDANDQVENYGAVQYFKTDVDALANALLKFAQAATKEEAEARFQSIIRTFKLAEKSAADVVRCGDAPPESSDQ